MDSTKLNIVHPERIITIAAIAPLAELVAVVGRLLPGLLLVLRGHRHLPS